MKLYTKRGDKGETDLIGARVSKSNPRVDTYGHIDELNTVLGMVVTYVVDSEVQKLLKQVQKDLFAVGAELSTAPNQKPLVRLKPKAVKRIEKAIDRLQEKFPFPKFFILPGGTFEASLLHFARTVCRRAERSVVSLAEKEPVRLYVVKYLNRLSDLLFALALLVNKEAGMTETIWKGRGN